MYIYMYIYIYMPLQMGQKTERSYYWSITGRMQSMCAGRRACAGQHRLPADWCNRRRLELTQVWVVNRRLEPPLDAAHVKKKSAAGSSPSMQPLVFWPRAGAFRAGAILEPRAQLVWCGLYDLKD